MFALSLRRGLSFGLLGLVLFFLGRCPAPPSSPPPPDKWVLTSGSFVLEVERSSGTLRLLREGKELVRLPREGLQLGVVLEYEKKYNYDPYWLEEHQGKRYIPHGLDWLSPQSVKLQAAKDKEILLLLTYPKDLKAQLSLKLHSPGTFQLRWTPKNPPDKLVYTRLALQVDAKENYYGLGEYFDHLAHRGHLRAMQIEVDMSLESRYNEAHVPVPFFTSTRAWGLFVRSRRPAVFDMAKGDPHKVVVTYHAQKLEFFFFAANHPLEVPGLYTKITGAPALPARWAFGTFLWRDENRDQAEVLDDASKIRQHDLAISALWIDRPYDTAVNNFRFDPARYPDPRKMISTLHDQGFRLGVWSTPYLEPKAEKHDYAKSKGWFVKMGFVKLNKWSDPLDLTNPEAFRFWQEMIQRMIDLGIEGFKLDYGEDIQVGIPKLRTPYGFANGEDERTMHHGYALYYHRAYAEKLPKNGGFLLCRGGTYGDQRYASIIWPGDLDNSFHRHGECEKGTCHVGGLIASMVAGLSLSQSGFPLYGSDTGGYRHGRPPKDVFMRWGQQTALSAIMQIGGGGENSNPWDFKRYGKSQFDQEVLDSFRRYIRLHTRLFPYNYTYAVAAHNHKPGVMRPYGMAYPQEDFHPDDEYLFGEHLLVAPVVTAQNKRSIRFPKGSRWLDWWTYRWYKGGTTTQYEAPLDRLPLFLREGAIVPLLRPDIDTLAPSKEASIVSFARQAGLLVVLLVPGKASRFVVYDKTTISLSANWPLQITLAPGQEFTFGVHFQILAAPPPQQIQVADQDLQAAADKDKLDQCAKGCWFYEASKKILHIRLPHKEHKITVNKKP